MTSRAEGADDGKVAAFVREELRHPDSDQRAAREHLFVRDDVSRVFDGRPYVGLAQVWVSVQKIRLACAFAQFAEDQFNCNPRASDYRLSEHHVRIHLNTIGEESHSCLNLPNSIADWVRCITG